MQKFVPSLKPQNSTIKARKSIFIRQKDTGKLRDEYSPPFQSASREFEKFKYLQSILGFLNAKTSKNQAEFDSF